MTRRIIFLGFVCSMLVSTTGCGLLQCLLCPRSICDPQYCPQACGPGCGPACGPECGPSCAPTCEPCEAACAEPVPPACGLAPVPTCDAPCGVCGAAPCGPLSWICGLFGGDSWCGSGCGEVYCGDWCGDPPYCCDPCDHWGNYTGGGYCGGYAPGAMSYGLPVESAPEIVRAPPAIQP